MDTQPDLGIEHPYALDDDQLAAAVELLKAQKEHVGEYWSDYLKEVQAFTTGDSVVGTTWQVIANVAQGENVPVEVTPARGGRDRLVGHLDGRDRRAEPELRLRVDRPHHQPRGERRGRGVLR